MDYKYIIIFEDGQIYKTNEMSEDDIMGCDSGILDIVRIEDQKSYFNRDWHDLEVWAG